MRMRQRIIQLLQKYEPEKFGKNYESKQTFIDDYYQDFTKPVVTHLCV